jgi:para-nitrobenzyl esterase
MDASEETGEATAEMQDVYKSNDEIIAEIEADDTLEDDMKSTILSTILNGRWFSDDLDAYFGTPSLWE